jgi:hypothetical protein
MRLQLWEANLLYVRTVLSRPGLPFSIPFVLASHASACVSCLILLHSCMYELLFCLIFPCVVWLEILGATWFLEGYIQPDVTPWEVGIAFTSFNRNACQKMFTSGCDASDCDRWLLQHVRGTVFGSTADQHNMSAWFAGFAFSTWESSNHFWCALFDCVHTLSF